ncbi:MAG TPA: hypothetical protein DCE55_29290 [Planctomycetaceae bacterium]|nr:hypothetical protein [Planctomycetaceae bacterium]|tara:strand:- start:13369 stop:14277 length:909 start_codon:yes stop_codon:yes gene_type:complete
MATDASLGAIDPQNQLFAQLGCFDTQPRILVLDADLYHAEPLAINRGKIQVFRKSRREFFAKCIERSVPPKKATKAMQIGTLAHAGLLEPHEFKSLYVVAPDDCLTSAGYINSTRVKMWKAEQVAKGHLRSDVIVLTQEGFQQVQQIVLAVDKKVGSMIRKAIVEHAIYWTDEKTKLRCKCRPDILIPMPEYIIVIDIKTTDNALKWPPNQQKSSNIMQAVHYSQGIKALYGDKPIQFVFLAVGKEPPHLTRTYEFDDEDQNGYVAWRDALDGIAQCISTGDWSDPGEDEIQKIYVRRRDLN